MKTKQTISEKRINEFEALNNFLNNLKEQQGNEELQKATIEIDLSKYNKGDCFFLFIRKLDGVYFESSPTLNYMELNAYLLGYKRKSHNEYIKKSNL